MVENREHATNEQVWKFNDSACEQFPTKVTDQVETNESMMRVLMIELENSEDFNSYYTDLENRITTSLQL